MLEQYESHPAAAAFPLMMGEDYAELVDDIRSNGLLRPITRMPGRKLVILDGRNAFRACIDAGVEPTFVEYGGHDPVRFVISMNLRRRHLSASVRALAAARLMTLAPGRPKKQGRTAQLSKRDVAKELGIGERTVQIARSVLKHAVPEVVAAVERGDMTITAAAGVAELGRKQQREQVANPRQANHRPDVAVGGKRQIYASVARAIAETELVALNALARVGDEAKDPRARAGVVVLRKIVPAVHCRG